MFQEPLVHIPFEKWSELQSAFKTDWPRGAAGYMILDTQKLLIEEGYDYGFKVYCPFGEVRNGMVAVNVKETLNEIIIHCPQDDTGKLEDALRNTRRVNWQKSVVPSAPYHVIHCLQRALGEDINVKLLPSDTFVYDKPVAFKNTDLPPEITFGLITSDNLDLVDSTWPYRYASSRWYFQLLMNMKFGYGLFEANQLVAWVLVNEAGVLLHLYTVESHRRKGYAELILKLDSFYEIIIQCPKDDTEKLADALRKTKIVDWNKKVVVPYAPRNVIECLRNTVQDVDVKLSEHRFLETLILEDTKGEDVTLPNDITFGPVTLEHLDLVDSTWPNRYATLAWHFRLLINTKSGFGLYLNNILISWVFIKETGPIQHLYTVEEHRKKGYAQLLLKLASKIWLEEGKPVFAFCFKDNVSVCKVYRKVGFVSAEQIAWCYFNKG